MCLALGLWSRTAADTIPVAPESGRLVRVPLTITNEDAQPITCPAELAHWYSVDLGTAAAHGSLTAVLWADPLNGTLFVANTKGEEIPVLRIRCGRADAGLENQAEVPLERHAGRVPLAISLACQSVNDRLTCRPHADRPPADQAP